MAVNYAVILSGGVGTRYGSNDIPKQYCDLFGHPVIYWVIKQYAVHLEIDEIIIVADDSWKGLITDLCSELNITKPMILASPGRCRQESVKNGMNVIPRQIGDDDLVIFQDAARPLVTSGMISNCIHQCSECDGTVVYSRPMEGFGVFRDNVLIDTMDGNDLVTIQSPDCYHLKKYKEIVDAATYDELKASRGGMHMALKHEMIIHLVEGENENIKVTYPNDIEYIERAFSDAFI